MKAFKRLRLYMILVLLFGLGSHPFPLDGQKVITLPKAGTPTSYEISSNFKSSERSTIISSARSVVKIQSIAPNGINMAGTTGTWFVVDGQNYIVTVAHGLIGGCRGTFILIGTNVVTSCTQMIEYNSDVDYAILRVGEIKTSFAKPVKMKKRLPMNENGWNRVLSLQNSFFYTGYPNSSGPFTIAGRIIGYTRYREYIYGHSYAWTGSSGSGIFSSDGHFIGIVVAIEVGQTVYGYDVLEDIVIILPADRIDWTSLIPGR
jgi:hypothetical protein